MKRQMISGCVVAAAVVAASAGCTDTHSLEAEPEERHAAKSVIEVEATGLGWTTYRPDWTVLTCAVFRTSLTDQLRAYVLAGLDAQVMDAGVRNAARALADAADAGGDARDVVKLESGMRTACYAYELSMAAVAGSIGHSYEGR
jgi:hypothetical protein